MTIELASRTIVNKPWGQVDPSPWTAPNDDGAPIGEIWFGRDGASLKRPALLLKLLFTAESLSVQVHPDDAQAQSAGEPNGKSEAWYVIGSAPGARVAVGLKRRLTGEDLAGAIADGSIADLLNWRHVVAGEAIHVPARTIHAIGAGFVIAEIQQRSDTTYRLFDHGRPREIHALQAMAVAETGPSSLQPAPSRLTDARLLLVTSPHFVLERIDLPAGSNWQFDADDETWLLVLDGTARFGELEGRRGQAFFTQAEQTVIGVGAEPLVLLVAYPGPDPASSLLYNLDGRTRPSSAAEFARPPSTTPPVARVPAAARDMGR